MAAMTGSTLAALTPVFGIYQADQARKEAKEAARSEEQRIKQQKEEALKKRKSLVDKQRRQISGSGFDINPTGSTGLSGGSVNQGLLG